jgi:hypothetical protein
MQTVECVFEVIIMADVKVSSGGCSMGMVLFLIFLALKLTGYITWSWWWVTCPLWGGLAIILTLFALVVGIAAAISLRKG